MSKFIVTMKYKKSTKGTHVFEEEVPEDQNIQFFSSIPSLYIRKAALIEPAKMIKVTVEVLS